MSHLCERHNISFFYQQSNPLSPAHDLGEGSFHQIVRRDVEVQLYLRLQAGEKHKGEVVFTQGREERVID